MAALELVLGGGVGAFYLFVSWRRGLTIRGYFRARKREKQVENDLRALRDEARQGRPTRAATDDDSARVALLAVTDRDVQVFVELGFTLLGDIITDGVFSGAMRTLVARDGTTVAIIMVAEKLPTIVGVQLGSYGEMSFSTHAGKRMSLADSPSMRRKVLAAGTPHRELLAQHVELAKTSSQPLLRFTSRDDLVAQINARRAATALWRNEQSDEKLLDEDVRALFGEHYQKIGWLWMRRLRDRLPQATLRR